MTPDATDTNPFRYCGEYYDTETGTYYLRARYYDPRNGRFLARDTHWTSVNSIYGDNPQKLNERQDKLGLRHYSYAPQISAIMQAGNLYVYCVENLVRYVDRNGENAAEALQKWTELAWWLPFIDGPLPIGELIFATGVLVFGGIAAYEYCEYSDWRIAESHINKESTNRDLVLIEYASTAAMPPPPNDPNSKGTKTSSTTLYEKGKIHIDVENPGYRQGQIHLQKGNAKYYYDIANKCFKIGGTSGELAPNSIQKMLEDPEVIHAIARGLKYLGYTY